MFWNYIYIHIYVGKAGGEITRLGIWVESSAEDPDGTEFFPRRCVFFWRETRRARVALAYDIQHLKGLEFDCKL